MAYKIDDVVKELIADMLAADGQATVGVTKEGDRYRIVAVSTAAIKDREDEIFTTTSMDYEILQSKETGRYPEFRVFHSPALGIGTVEKMSRVGIFAVDEGYSYTDAFSLSVCKDLLENNDGKWRVSRGFKALEISVSCPSCSSTQLITKEHMIAGFRCPVCKQVHLSYKGMPNVQYMKTETFDVTVTDVPAVPMTSVAAFTTDINEVKSMNKKELKERLLAAGLDEVAIDTRLKSITDDQMKELGDDVPDATLLKEFSVGEEQVMVLDDGVLDAIAERVTVTVKELLDGFDIELSDLDMDVEFKEIPEIVELKEMVAALQEQMSQLLADDDERLKEHNTPAARHRLSIYKSGTKKKITDEDVDEEDEEDEEEGETNNGKPVNKSTARWFKSFKERPLTEEALIDADGEEFKSLSEFMGVG